MSNVAHNNFQNSPHHPPLTPIFKGNPCFPEPPLLWRRSRSAPQRLTPPASGNCASWSSRWTCNEADRSLMCSNGPGTPHRLSAMVQKTIKYIWLNKRIPSIYRKIRSPSRLLLRLIRVVNQCALLPVQHEPPPRPAMERGSQLVQVTPTGSRIHRHMRTQIDLMPSWLNVLPQVQVSWHNGKVSGK